MRCAREPHRSDRGANSMRTPRIRKTGDRQGRDERREGRNRLRRRECRRRRASHFRGLVSYLGSQHWVRSCPSSGTQFRNSGILKIPPDTGVPKRKDRSRPRPPPGNRKVVAPRLTADVAPQRNYCPKERSENGARKFATDISDFATLVRKSYYGAPSPIDYSG